MKRGEGGGERSLQLDDELRKPWRKALGFEFSSLSSP